MSEVHKRLVTDEHDRPVAVQIDYSDWLAIEGCLPDIEKPSAKVTDLSRHAGGLSLAEEPVEYQARVRQEWR